MSTQYDRLQQAMKAANKGWDDLRAASGVTRAGVKKWRDGNFKELSSTNLFALADLLGCDARWLAIGELDAAPESDSLGEVRAIWNRLNDEGQMEITKHAQYVASQERFLQADPRPKSPSLCV